MAVKMRVAALDTSGADKWYVTDGAHAVGPVRLDLLARGIEAGRVPLDSFVRHEAWKVWRPLTDFTDYVNEPRTSSARGGVPASASDPLPRFPTSDDGLGAPYSAVDSSDDGDRATLASAEDPPARAPSLVEFATSEGVASRSSFDSIPPPHGGIAPVPSWTGDADPDDFLDEIDADLATDVSRDLLGDDHLELRAAFEAYPTKPQSERAPPKPPVVTDDIPSSAEGKEGWGSARAAESSDSLADDDLRGAADLSDAMLLLLGAAVRRTRSEVALLHRVSDVGATVVCAHGFSVDAAPLGHETTFVDPIFVAAASGMLVLAEPAPGSAGMAMARRLGIRVAGRPILGALMLPITVNDRLFGFIELGKTKGYSARELLKGEDLVAAFVRHALDRGFDLS